jgi:hypothetical protein
MSLLFIDSHDHYDFQGYKQKYTTGLLAGVELSKGRHGTYGTSPWGALIAPWNPGPGHARVLIGSAIGVNFGPDGFYGIGDIGTNLCGLGMQVDGRLRFNTPGGTYYDSDPDILKSNLGRWYFIELDVTIDISSAVPPMEYRTLAVKVYVDGTKVIDQAGPSPWSPTHLEFPSAFGWSFVTRGGVGSGQNADDFYLCDGAGGAPFNNLLGDVQTGAIFPNGVGFINQFTPSAGANWENVNEEAGSVAPDDDTTYNASPTNGHTDLFTMMDVDTDDTLMAIQMLISSRRTQEGFASLTPMLRQAGVNYDGLNRQCSPAYLYRHRDVRVLAPDGSAWTDAILNAIQAGYRRGV